MIPAWYNSAARFLFTVFSVLTSLYCVLAYLPFTYHQVHRGNLFPALARFSESHHWWNVAVFLAVAPVIVPELIGRKTPASRFWAAFGWLAANSAWALGLLWRPLLPELENAFSAYLVSLIPLALAVWLSLLGLAELASDYSWPEASSDCGGTFAAALLAAAWVPVVTGAVALWRQGGATAAAWASGYVWSGSTQAIVFLLGFTGLHWAASLARFSRRAARAEFLLAHVAAVVVGAAAMSRVAFGPIGFSGWSCLAYSAAFSFALCSAWAAIALPLARGRAASGFEVAFAPLTGGRPGSVAAGLVGAVAVAAVCGIGLARASVMDWNNLVQRLFSILLWMGSFGVAFGFIHRRVPASARWAPFLLTALILLGGYRKLQARLTPSAAAIENYSGYDAPFSFARELLAPPQAGGAVFQIMAKSTNLPHSARIAPVELSLVSRWERHTRRPHIFIITVDSLRRDYLSAYNPAVDFTPAIGSFAKESTVFASAFTHYGGTGLSEPSIWTGSMMIHKQYVTPFAPMNLLEKLLHAEGYAMHVSRDEILKTILEPARPGDGDLDAGRATMSLDLCQSLEELTRVVARDGQQVPLFAYSQPQNIHISVIQREGAKPIDSADYKGFYAPYASRIRRMDGCFGRFIGNLKQAGLYDSSVIIFTADHGDSLGEQGRWGHAYTLFPEVVRIPLLVHLPADLAAKLRPVTGRPVFSTDITPALYRLLGYRPAQTVPLVGRPLFTDPAEGETAERRDWHLLASSYAPVYGVLSENGRRMYVADGVGFRDYWFDLSGAQPAALTLPEEVRQRQQARIREGIEEINKLYRFESEAGSR